MHRRNLLFMLGTLGTTRSLLAAAEANKARIGLCAFSCHQQWKAVGDKHPGVKFTDALSYYRYARSLGSEGVQVSLKAKDAALAKQLRAAVESDGGYYEGEVRLPKAEADVDAFERDVKLVREAGATVARAVFTGGRRYEIFKSMDEFRAFHAQAEKSLALAEPVLRKHKLKVAMENHKDHTADELAGMMTRLSNEWIGVLVDTGNNIALLDAPYEAIEKLAPFVMSVHFKDMAVQTADDGFLLSEVPVGTGALDMPRIVSTLCKANPSLVLNLEMGTRDPLHVPCLTDAFYVTMPERKGERRDAAMNWVKANPPKQPPPMVSGKAVDQVLAEEEANNRSSLGWMHAHVRA